MRLDIILGINIDTPAWIALLNNQHRENIIVIDYIFKGNSYEENNITYMSVCYGTQYSKNFKDIFFYKSLYSYPLIKGNMNSIYGK